MAQGWWPEAIFSLDRTTSQQGDRWGGVARNRFAFAPWAHGYRKDMNNHEQNSLCPCLHSVLAMLVASLVHLEG
jgi:hypothetical protein